MVEVLQACPLNKIFAADLFVPCGGRPESINVSNVNTLFDGEGKVSGQRPTPTRPRLPS